MFDLTDADQDLKKKLPLFEKATQGRQGENKILEDDSFSRTYEQSKSFNAVNQKQHNYVSIARCDSNLKEAFENSNNSNNL